MAEEIVEKKGYTEAELMDSLIRKLSTRWRL